MNTFFSEYGLKNACPQKNFIKKYLVFTKSLAKTAQIILGNIQIFGNIIRLYLVSKAQKLKI
jgi:hypothetical protein